MRRYLLKLTNTIKYIQEHVHELDFTNNAKQVIQKRMRAAEVHDKGLMGGTRLEHAHCQVPYLMPVLVCSNRIKLKIGSG